LRRTTAEKRRRCVSPPRSPFDIKAEGYDHLQEYRYLMEKKSKKRKNTEVRLRVLGERADREACLFRTIRRRRIVF
jgi:hypothetical protein